jgi:hypothetical protein
LAFSPSLDDDPGALARSAHSRCSPLLPHGMIFDRLPPDYIAWRRRASLVALTTQPRPELRELDR